jgi:hypothetical protein
MKAITDDFMQEMIGKTREYCIVILKAGPERNRPDTRPLIWEHARRNFALREEGILAIVCPVNDGSDVSGIGIFTAPADKVREIMDGDPAVQAGIFTYEIHPARSFPGDCLPE